MINFYSYKNFNKTYCRLIYIFMQDLETDVLSGTAEYIKNKNAQGRVAG
jgi:hypothetical protein